MSRVAILYRQYYFSYRLIVAKLHPMSDEVVRILRSITGALSLSGGVLALGDSTSAYCVGREKEVNWGDLTARARGDCGGVNFYFEAWFGATPRALVPQAANAAWWGCSYDWVLLIGVGIHTE